MTCSTMLLLQRQAQSIKGHIITSLLRPTILSLFNNNRSFPAASQTSLKTKPLNIRHNIKGGWQGLKLRKGLTAPPLAIPAVVMSATAGVEVYGIIEEWDYKSFYPSILDAILEGGLPGPVADALLLGKDKAKAVSFAGVIKLRNEPLWQVMQAYAVDIMARTIIEFQGEHLYTKTDCIVAKVNCPTDANDVDISITKKVWAELGLWPSDEDPIPRRIRPWLRKTGCWSRAVFFDKNCYTLTGAALGFKDKSVPQFNQAPIDREMMNMVSDDIKNRHLQKSYDQLWKFACSNASSLPSVLDVYFTIIKADFGTPVVGNKEDLENDSAEGLIDAPGLQTKTAAQVTEEEELQLLAYLEAKFKGAVKCEVYEHNVAIFEGTQPKNTPGSEVHYLKVMHIGGPRVHIENPCMLWDNIKNLMTAAGIDRRMWNEFNADQVLAVFNRTSATLVTAMDKALNYTLDMGVTRAEVLAKVTMHQKQRL